MEICRRHTVPRLFQLLRYGYGDSWVWIYPGAVGTLCLSSSADAEVTVCLCVSPLPAQPLSQLHLARHAEFSLPGFPLCSFGFILLGFNFQSVFGCLSKAPRCRVFTENQWGLAIKCFHLSLLKMSPINNKTKAKSVCVNKGFSNRLHLQQEVRRCIRTHLTAKSCISGYKGLSLSCNFHREKFTLVLKRLFSQSKCAAEAKHSAF